jgi:hypothetical protein
MVGPWKDAQWEVVMLDDTLTLVDGEPWQLAIAKRLGLELKNNEE